MASNWPHCDTHLRLCHSEQADTDRIELLKLYEKVEITGSEMQAVGWMTKHLPDELLQQMC